MNSRKGKHMDNPLVQLLKVLRTDLPREGLEIANSLQTLLELTPQADVAVLCAAWRILAAPRATDTQAIAERRAVCDTLYWVFTTRCFEGERAEEAIPIWETWLHAAKGPLVGTFQRELAELRSATQEQNPNHR